MGWFESWYDRLMAPLERGSVGEWRRGLLSKAHGRVLEVGVGTGANLPYYPPDCRVVGIEPSAKMLQQAVTKLKADAIYTNSIEILSGTAEDLPFPDATFDTVIATLVLCSVQDPRQSVAEMHRVLKPGGTLLLLEHVVVKSPLIKPILDLLTPPWRHLMGNCHLNRDTASTVRNAFANVRIDSRMGGLFLHIEAEKERQVKPL